MDVTEVDIQMALGWMDEYELKCKRFCCFLEEVSKETETNGHVSHSQQKPQPFNIITKGCDIRWNILKVNRRGNVKKETFTNSQCGTQKRFNYYSDLLRPTNVKIDQKNNNYSSVGIL